MLHTKWAVFWILFLLFSLSGCGIQTTSLPTGASPVVSDRRLATPAVMASPSLVVNDPRLATPTVMTSPSPVMITPTQIRLPEATPTRKESLSTPPTIPTPASIPPIDPPTGLIYFDGDSQWFVDSDQRPIPFAPSMALISPNKRFAVYLDPSPYSDIWRMDLVSGEKINLTRNVELDPEQKNYRSLGAWSPDSRTVYYLEYPYGESQQKQDIWSVGEDQPARKLTNTVGRSECCLQYWPNNDVLVFLSRDLSEELFGGQPTLMNPNGSGYRILAEKNYWVPPDISPDGQTLAFLGGGIYKPESGFDELSFAATNLPDNDDTYLELPAWSPDGRSIAWPAFGTENGIGITDLVNHTLNIYHPYTNYFDGEGFLIPPVWSPDSNWLACELYDSMGPASLWILRADEGEEHLLGAGSYPVWSPDSRYIVYSGEHEGEEGIWMVDVQTWDAARINLPDSIELVSWYGPSSVPGWIENRSFSTTNNYTYTVTEAGANLIFRSKPSLAADQLTPLKPGDQFTIVAGPTFADAYQWWQIKTLSGDEGWIIEHNGWYR